MSAPAEAPSPGPAAPSRHRPPRPGLQAVVGLGAVALVLGLISVFSIISNDRQGLRAAVIGPRRVAPGDAVRWQVSVRDTAGSASHVEFEFGDGQSAQPVGDRPPPRCDPERTATSELFEFEHVYPRAGIYTARVRVTSEGCGAAREGAHGERTVTVKAVRR